MRQEFWGLLLAHHVVRKLMLEAALSRQRPPDTLSFKHSLALIRRKLPTSGAIPPEQFQKWWSALIKEAATGGLASPRGRSNPRVVKRRTKQYPPCKGNEVLNIRQNWTVAVIK